MLRKQSHILFVALFAVLQVQALSKFRKKQKNLKCIDARATRKLWVLNGNFRFVLFSNSSFTATNNQATSNRWTIVSSGSTVKRKWQTISNRVRSRRRASAKVSKTLFNTFRKKWKFIYLVLLSCDVRVRVRRGVTRRDKSRLICIVTNT